MIKTISNATLIAVKEWYAVTEVATMLGRDAYTIRRWCRQERIAARKRACGRGRHTEWEIHANEIWRYLNHGLRSSTVADNSVSFS